MNPVALLVLLLLSSATTTYAQGPAAREPLVLRLWESGTPGAPESPPAEVVKDRAGGGDRHVSGVHVPTITVYLPEGELRVRSAVVVCPGGGYGVLALDKEGHDIARWYAKSGVVGVVLKYRLPRPAGHVYGHEAPLNDARRALELVRLHAHEWGVDPKRVGIMGFSAGGHLAASASVQLGEAGPNFSVLIYPVVSMLDGVTHMGSRANLLGPEADEALIRRFSSELGVSGKTPPAFLVTTSDDWVKAENSLGYYSALRRAGVLAELHVFARGGHGYGMRKPELPVGTWPELLLQWMKAGGLLAAPLSTHGRQVQAPPAAMGLDPFYAKYVDAGGYPIVASAQVNDYALLEAAYLVDMLLARRPDVRKAMVASGSRLIIMGRQEFTTQMPEYADFTPKDYWDRRARGLGGSRTDPVCSCAEENVLAFPGDPYSTESIVIHEFAHNIHLRGMLNVDPSFDERVEAAYAAAMEQGLWKTKYASTNRNEYFAEGVQSWFDNNREDDHDHNHVNTRAELIEYDPGLAALCREVFGDTELVYTKPTTRLRDHMAGYDPSAAPTFVWPEHLKQVGKEIQQKANARK
jgi:acetyl esterase/lipase